MDHVKAILIKFVMIAVVLLIVLTWIFDVSFGDTLWISAALTLLAYVLGDLVIFRKAGDADDQGKRNMIATVSDIILAFLIVWFLGDAMAVSSDIVTAAIVSAILIGGGEWFFHKYLDRNVFAEKHDRAAQTH
ncbi:DUF2512 family protein [Planococcus lenghuensis]|uniref:DUF2512 family protein n=1 Tax=Planococcus lenghuensis TaxID=2213202 RepID=A0A1Q2KZN1_9BACL|nr:DUF2512 family protein [Planococcus lenghuensis]AQQ53584.1 hypothetical protein B0X71_11200 [Planococcus lenghuensis]